jgi:MFS family permease
MPGPRPGLWLLSIQKNHSSFRNLQRIKGDRLAPDDKKRFIGLSSFEALAMFRRGLFYAYLTIYLRHYLGLSVTATTLFATLPMLVNVLSQTFIWGRVSDRFQLRRSLIMTGEASAAVGTVAVWYLHRLSDNPISAGLIIIFGLTVVELFWSMSNISWSALIADLYAEDQRGAIQGRLTSMGGLGRIVGIWVGGFFYEGLDHHLAGWGFYHGDLFFIAAAVMLISTIPLFLLPEGGIKPGAEPRNQNPSISNRSSNNLQVYLVFLVGMLMINFGRNSIAIIFPQYLTSTSGPAVDSRTLSLILNTQSAAIVVLGWIIGRIYRSIGTSVTLLTASALAATALIMLASSQRLELIYLASFLRGAADVAILASAYELASVFIPPQQRARRFAWFNATFFLSWGLPGTLVVGPLVDFLIAHGYIESHAYRVSFLLAAGLVLAGLVMQAMLLYAIRTGIGFKDLSGQDAH